MHQRKEGHLLPDCSWLWVTETAESKTADKEGLLNLSRNVKMLIALHLVILHLRVYNKEITKSAETGPQLIQHFEF